MVSHSSGKGPGNPSSFRQFPEAVGQKTKRTVNKDLKEGAHTPRGVQLGQSYLQGSAVSFCPVLEETQGLQNLLGRKG